MYSEEVGMVAVEKVRLGENKVVEIVDQVPEDGWRNSQYFFPLKLADLCTDDA